MYRYIPGNESGWDGWTNITPFPPVGNSGGGAKKGSQTVTKPFVSVQRVGGGGANEPPRSYPDILEARKMC